MNSIVLKSRNWYFYISIGLISVFSTQSWAQECDDPVFPPTEIDGVDVTESIVGDVSTYPLSWISCEPEMFETPPDCPYFGSFGAFEYTLNFSEPVNDICFILTGTGGPDSEVFTVTTSAGVPDVIDEGSCYTDVVGNVITSGTGAVDPIMDDDGFVIGGGGGGLFKVSNPTGPYTSITISGPGGVAGSLFSLCSGCMTTDFLEITSEDISCFGACDGTAEVIEGSDPPYSYAWSDEAGGATTAAVSDLCPGTYSVDVTNGSGVIETLEVTIAEPEEIVIDLFTVTDASCFGAEDGSLNATASGGEGALVYDIGGADQATGNFDAVSAGDYTLTVTDENGCSTNQDFEILGASLMSISVTSENVSCFGYSDGTVSVELEGGVAPYTYSVNGVDFDEANTFTDLDAGTYTLTGRDDNGCTTEGTVFITEPEEPIANFSYNPNPISVESPIVTFSDQSENAVSWDWQFDLLGTSDDQNPTFTFPPDARSYTVGLTVEDENGCTASTEQILTVLNDFKIFAPNAFTPDGDLFNEVFLPYLTGIDIYDYQLVIYNKWGEVIFESYNPTVGWNGTYGGEIVQDGVYVWTISVKEISSDRREEVVGHVTVLN